MNVAVRRLGRREPTSLERWPPLWVVFLVVALTVVAVVVVIGLAVHTFRDTSTRRQVRVLRCEVHQLEVRQRLAATGVQQLPTMRPCR